MRGEIDVPNELQITDENLRSRFLKVRTITAIEIESRCILPFGSLLRQFYNRQKWIRHERRICRDLRIK